MKIWWQGTQIRQMACPVGSCLVLLPAWLLYGPVASCLGRLTAGHSPQSPPRLLKTDHIIPDPNPFTANGHWLGLARSFLYKSLTLLLRQLFISLMELHILSCMSCYINILYTLLDFQRSSPWVCWAIQNTDLPYLYVISNHLITLINTFNLLFLPFQLCFLSPLGFH